MLEIKDLSAGYARRTVITDINATFKKGSLISIIGPNGSGKSTLLKAITGIIPAMSGDVFLDSVPIMELTQKQRAQKIAYLPQGKNTPDMTEERLVLHGRFPHISYPRHYTPRDREIALDAMK